MESEEFEQIPWASLVAQQDDGMDKRIYLVVGVVGLLVIAVFGIRLLGGGSQPVPPGPAALGPPPTITSAVEPSAAPPTSPVIAEADLRAEEPVETLAVDRLTEVTAEWFVTDWFTRDGSDETVRSIRSMLAPDVLVDTLPHEGEQPATFVEWAKTVATDVTTERIEVTVAFRVIRETDEGFVRDPVDTVIVTLIRDGDNVSVVTLPES